MARQWWLGLSLAGLVCSAVGEGKAAAPIPPAPHAPGHVLIKFRETARREVRGHDIATGLENLSRRLTLPPGAALRESAFAEWRRARARRTDPAGKAAPTVDTSRWMYLDLPPGLSPSQCVDRLRDHPLVEYVEPDGMGSGGDILPDDPEFPRQWHHRNTVRPGAEIGTPAAWDLTTGSSHIIVAVLDTGLNAALAEFAGRVVPGFDYVNNDGDPADDQGHGTLVAGTLAARGQNGSLGAGVDWQCRLMPVKVLDENNTGFYSHWAQGIDFAAANGAKVINLSAGGSSPSATLEQAIDDAIAAGVIFVTITHNDGAAEIRFPGRLPQSITVGATDIQDRKAAFSNYGPEIDLVAPGQDIVTVNRFGGVGTVNGTSFAAPMVAGVCALMAGLNPALTQGEAQDLLTENANDQVGDAKDTPGFDSYYGHGRLNAFNAVLAAYSGGADLALAQRESFEPASIGCALTYTLTLTNRGGLMASNVVVTNFLSANAEFLTATSSQGTWTADAARLVFALGDLAGQSHVVMEVVVQPTAPGMITNRAELSSSLEDPLPENNMSVETTPAFWDDAGPQVLSAAARPDGRTVDIRFTEPVQGQGSTNLLNYALTDGRTNVVVVNQVLAGSDSASVILQAELRAHPAPFSLIVFGQEDCLGHRTVESAAVTLSVPAALDLVPAGSDWRYLDDGSDQGAAWRAADFDDGAWPSGRAQLGYGDGDEVTVLRFGSNPNSKFITTYFRHSFYAPDASLLTNATLRLLRDDGAVVYLNGIEIARQNMPGGDVAYNTLAAGAISGATESEFFAETVDPTLLVSGINVLAVELHQSDPDSSDISFDLSLSAQLVSLALPPSIVTQPESRTVVQGDDVEFSVVVSGTPPFGFEWRKFPQVLVPFGEGGPSLTLTNVQLTHAGSYLVFVTNSVTSGSGVASAIARLTVLADTDGDHMPDDWETSYALNPGDPADAEWDGDGDGATNLEEYRAGTHPWISNLLVRIDSIVLAAEGLQLQFQAAANRAYSVLYRSSISDGPWTKLMDVPAGPAAEVRQVLDPNPVTTRRFYRLVTPPMP